MRRILVVNALIFAVLAAAVALAYYGYTATSIESQEQQVLQPLRELAEEKVFNIENLLLRDERVVFDNVRFEELSKLDEVVNPVATAVASVFVLDDQGKLVPDGYVGPRSRKPAESKAFRDFVLEKVVPTLPLSKRPAGERGHVHGIWREGPLAGRPYLLSFVKRVSGDRTFYVLIEDDLTHLVAWLFPQFFNVSDVSKRIYQVVDERGELVFGAPFAADADTLVVEVPFSETVDGWRLRVTDRQMLGQGALRRKGIIQSVLIGGAVTVVIAGLAFLALAIRRERRANELKSEFISNVSHELKTPLSIISMFGEMLANGRVKGPDQATEYAEIIWRESVRLGRLIDNVLDFAKIERGMGVYEFADADVGEVVDRAIELVGRRLAAAEMTLDAEIEPDLPQVKLDQNAFTLAVLNLIDNAIKYAAEGKKIELRLARAGDRIALRVRDWGPGIDPAEQEQIFERFYRARAVRLKPIRGSGIGLALVRHIAKAHGGDVTVTSAPGQGSTFELWLPVV
ncbi:MAG: HAMP domain-containing histidine kinase [Deltaproteobacteria bacterium]|nr:HAMP domain-containing histidine kinase [Deltaproteobacteria bacterium]